MRLTEHFTRDEMMCRCGCGRADMDPAFMEQLEAIRIRYGRPMIVLSGYRCPEHNARVSSTGRTGPHTTGRAVDIAVRGSDAYQLIRLALEHGMTGIGVSQRDGVPRFIHLDSVPRTAVWSY